MKRTPQIEMLELLQRYSYLKDALLDHTGTFHDGMLFDIDGYWESYYMDDFDDLPTLRDQVDAFELILIGLQKVKYVFC